MIYTRSPWTRQPQYPVGLTGGSLVNGLQLIWTATNPTSGGFGQTVSLVGNPALESTSKGLGVSLNGSSKSINTNRKITYPSGTILLLSNIKALGANKRIFTQTSNDAGSGEGIVLADDGNFSINGGNISLLSLSVGLNNIVCTWGGSSSHTGYLNGVPQAPYGGSGGTPASAAGDYNFEIGAFSYSGGRIFWSNQTPLLACIWSRILTRGEIAALSENPWQLFAPVPRRIWVPTYYYYILQDASKPDPSAQQIVSGLDGSGSAAAAKGNVSGQSAGTGTSYGDTATGLSQGANYEEFWTYYDNINYSPVAKVTFQTTVTVQLLRPASDITTGAWTPSTGTTLYGVIDESTPDDNDYMLTTTNSTAEIKFTPGSTPSAGNIVIRYRAKNNGTGALTAYLYQGATLKATHNPTLTNTFQTFTWTLTSGEASSITDFTDLRVRFTSS